MDPSDPVLEWLRKKHEKWNGIRETPFHPQAVAIRLDQLKGLIAERKAELRAKEAEA